MGAFVAAHFGFEIAIELPGVVNFGAVFPEADGQTRKVRSAKSGGFENARTNNGDAKDVGLKLHEEIVG